MSTALYLGTSHLGKFSHVLLGETTFQESFNQPTIHSIFSSLVDRLNQKTILRMSNKVFRD